MSAMHGYAMDDDSTWGMDEYIRSAQMDSGSDASLAHTDLEPYLRDSRPSAYSVVQYWCEHGNKMNNVASC